MSLPAWLWFTIGGAAVMSFFLLIFAVVTVRHHGWGQSRMAPPAVKWFVVAMTVGVVTVVGALLWSSMEVV